MSAYIPRFPDQAPIESSFCLATASGSFEARKLKDTDSPLGGGHLTVYHGHNSGSRDGQYHLYRVAKAVRKDHCLMGTSFLVEEGSSGCIYCLSNGCVSLKPEKSPSPHLKPLKWGQRRGEEAESHREHFPHSGSGLLGVHIKYPQQRKGEAGHVLLKAFSSCLWKLVPWGNKTEAKTALLGFYIQKPHNTKLLGNLDP